MIAIFEGLKALQYHIMINELRWGKTNANMSDDNLKTKRSMTLKDKKNTLNKMAKILCTAETYSGGINLNSQF